MSGPRTRSAARLVGAAAALALAAGSTGASAGTGDGYRKRAHRLEVQAQLLDTRAHRALLDVYALDSSLSAARRRLASLGARAARLRARQKRLARELAAARTTLAVSQRRLAQHLRSLYEQGGIDPLAIVLGSQSFDEALTKLDDLSRIARQNRELVDAATAARSRLVRARTALAAQRRAVAASLAEARAAERQLAAARAERSAYVGRLRAQRWLKESRIRGLLATARAVELKSQQIQAKAADTAGSTSSQPPSSTSSQGDAAAHGDRKLRVSATGYSLPGHTSSGLPVGWGIVAVDPNVIPLGTKMTVPGYGEAVAADTGSAVIGATIDLWFPTVAQARAWGRRTVVITLHEGH